MDTNLDLTTPAARRAAAVKNTMNKQFDLPLGFLFANKISDLVLIFDKPTHYFEIKMSG